MNFVRPIGVDCFASIRTNIVDCSMLNPFQEISCFIMQKKYKVTGMRTPSVPCYYKLARSEVTSFEFYIHFETETLELIQNIEHLFLQLIIERTYGRSI